MTRATFAKSCGLDSRCTSDATTSTLYGDMFIAVAVSCKPDFMYSSALELISVDTISSGDADGLMFHVPGAIRPSIRRWSLPIAVTDGTAQGGTKSEGSRVFSAAARRSASDTQCLSPSSSTQLALAIIVKMPGVVALVLT